MSPLRKIIVQYKSMPHSLRIIFRGYLFLPFVFAIGSIAKFDEILTNNATTFGFYIATYFVLPWIICFGLMRRTKTVLPLLILQLSAVLWHVAMNLENLPPNLHWIRYGMIVLVAVIAIVFCSRDILFPILSIKKRGFRLAPRVSVNKSLYLEDGENLVPLMLENCSLTGMAVYGEKTSVATILEKSKQGLAIRLRLLRKDPTFAVTATIASMRDDGSHMRFGLSIKESKIMSKFMSEALPSANKMQSRIWRFWASSHLQRSIMRTWVGFLLSSMILSMFKGSYALEDSSTNQIAMNAPTKTDSLTGKLTVVVEGFASDDGKLLLAVDNSEATYLLTEYRGGESKISERRVTYTFENIPFGFYAVRLFHDENNNGELDTNLLGIPTEAFGFSNNARAPFGAPSYNDSKFTFSPINNVITIKVKPYF